MSYKNIRCSCGKVGFDKKTAQTKRNQLVKKGNAKALRIYPCPESDTWHLTKKVWEASRTARLQRKLK